MRSKNRAEDFLTKEGLTKLEGWARSGLTMQQISNNCGVTIQTRYNWFSKHPEIRKAVDKGKEVVDFEVENALYKSAVGYEVTEQQVDSKGNKRLVKKFVPPNVVAQIFWLKNRMPDKWRDKQQTEITGNVPIVIKDDIKE